MLKPPAFLAALRPGNLRCLTGAALRPGNLWRSRPDSVRPPHPKLREGCRCLAGAALIIPLCVLSCRRPESPAASSRTIVVWEQDDASVAPFIDSVFESFRKLPENSGVTIIRSHYQNEDLRQQFQAASLADIPPDLIMGPSDAAGVYAVSGFILPVNRLFNLGKYNKAVLEAITLDNSTWGIPVSNGNHLMFFYNKRLAPKVPENTAELFRYCGGKARDLGLSYCMAFDMGEPFWLMPWLGAFGGWPIDDKTPTLDTKAMRDALNFYLDLKYLKKFVPAECDYNCMDALFKESRVAFIINGDWAISTYARQMGKDFGVARIPRLSATGKWPAPMVSGKYFMLSSALKGEKLELVIRLVDFYTDRENQVAQYRALRRLPALTEAMKASEITSDPVSRASISQLMKGRPMPMATEIRAVWDSIRPHMGRAVTRKVSVEEAVTKMQIDAVSKIKEMNQ
ncbi:MAG: extracellular solute-binding protein [bacterium]